MTPAQARRKLRSLLYRARLAEDLPEIEAELVAYLQEAGPQVIDGVRVSVEGDQLTTERLDEEDESEQLVLFPEKRR